MIDCLIGYIGLDSASGTAQSGLYLDALPDINLSNINKIADSSQKTNSEYDKEKVFADVEKRTILKFRILFISEFNNCHKLYKRELIDCLICENVELLSESIWYLMGAEMLQERLGSDRINRYTTVDRSKTKETQASFLEEFYRQLHIAVLGIDLESSTCFETDEKPECANLSTFFETTP
jgi:hypothetical protein